jgi:hypothetical protein
MQKWVLGQQLRTSTNTGILKSGVCTHNITSWTCTTFVRLPKAIFSFKCSFRSSGHPGYIVPAFPFTVRNADLVDRSFNPSSFSGSLTEPHAAAVDLIQDLSEP